MRYLFTGSDRKSFESDSNVSGRYIAFSKYADEIVAVVPTWRALGLPKSRAITDIASVHGTNGFTKIDGFLRTILLLTKFARTKKYDLIVARDPFEYGIVALIASKLSGVPFVVQLHTDVGSPWFGAGGFGNRVRKIVAPFVCKRAQGIRVISNTLRESMIRMQVLPAEKIVLVPPMYSEFLNERTEIPAITREQNQILIVSRLEFEKDISTAFRAIKQVITKNHAKNIQVQILGKGVEQESLKMLARELGIENNIHFRGWIEAPWKLFQSSHVFLQSGLYEGFGMSIVEAYAHGCFCVSTDVGVAPELLSTERDGGICAVKDVDCLSEKIMNALAQPPLSEFEIKARKEKIEKIIPYKTFEDYAGVFMRYLAGLVQKS